MKWPILIPVVEPPDFRRGNVYEHPPMDYYRYGEYPRYLRKPGLNQPETKTVWVEAASHDEAMCLVAKAISDAGLSASGQ